MHSPDSAPFVTVSDRGEPASIVVLSPIGVRFGSALGYSHHRGTQDSVTDRKPGLKDLDNGAGSDVLVRHLIHRLMQIRIELLPAWVDPADALLLKRLQ